MSESKPTDHQIFDACMSVRHDYGLMGPIEREKLRFEALEWFRAWEKAIYEPSGPPQRKQEAGELEGCPFCGLSPTTGPKDPKKEGDAWAFVKCDNPYCFAQPVIRFYEDSLLESEGVWLEPQQEILDAAIKIWNTRATPTQSE